MTLPTLAAIVSLIIVLTIGMIDSANALSIQIKGDLTPEQQAKLIYDAEKLAAETPISVREVREWAELGSALGEGLAAAAGAMGTEVNNFASTKVGFLTMFVIVWRYTIASVFGFLWLIFAVPAWVVMYRRTFIIDSVTYNPKGDGPRKVVKYMLYRLQEVF